MKREKFSSTKEKLEAWSIPEPNSGCWLWLRALTGTGGYGFLWYKGRKDRAHRVSWKEHFGEIPEGTHVLHRCDNPKCINPEHLFLGTPKDNSNDKVTKNRHAYGRRLPQTKLTEKEVIEIRADTRSYTQTCRDYGININTLWAIKHRKTWKHI
jgi:hypothetical protein